MRDAVARSGGRIATASRTFEAPDDRLRRLRGGYEQKVGESFVRSGRRAAAAATCNAKRRRSCGRKFGGARAGGRRRRLR